MTALDWGLVAAYCLFVLWLGVWAKRRQAGTEDTESYFLSGRNLPWWIAGASMAASAFSVDTPIYVTKLTQGGGISANWEWWFAGVSGILGAVVMARYWRRAGVMTDLELIQLRYEGRAAHVLRGFRAVFFGLLFNPMGMAAVVWAMTKVLGVVDPSLVDAGGWPAGKGIWIIGGVVVIATTYSVLSGFMGVVLTDLAQFVISIVGAVVLAVYAVGHPRVGGLEALARATAAKTSFLPALGWNEATAAFAIFLGVLWWTFINADGGGKYIQRLASCRDEREAERATWFSTVTFVALRSWPWILVALAALVIFPGGDAEAAYPLLMMGLRPGLRGLVFASLLAAFMSTIDTQINWGASYIVNDLLKPYVAPGRSERFYVLAARLYAVPCLAIVLLLFRMLAHQAPGGGASVLSVTELLRSVIAVSSGLGAIYLLRWFWWRLTAWGEIAGMVAAPLVATLAAHYKVPFAPKTLLVTAYTVGAAAAVSFGLPSRDRAHLAAFVARVRPSGWWGDMAPRTGDGGAGSGSGRWLLLRFIAGNAILFGLTFLVGGLLLYKPWWVTGGNAAAFALGLALDRWARRRLARLEPAQPIASITDGARATRARSCPESSSRPACRR